MNVHFENAEVTISGINILADNIYLNSDTSPAPSYALNIYTPPIYQGAAIKNTIQINYILEPSGDIAWKICSGLQNPSLSFNPVAITIAGLKSSYFLDNLRYEVLPNEPVKAISQWVGYDNLTGALSGQNPILTGQYNSSNCSGIAHYWSTTSISNNSPAQTGILIQAVFNAKINNEVAYACGKTGVAQVVFNNMQWDFDLMFDDYLGGLTYEPQRSQFILQNINLISIKNISSLWDTISNSSIDISLADSFLNSLKLSVPTNNIVTVNASLTKWF